MLQKLLSVSNLPNFHPAVVHFPIVLFCLALAAELLAIAWRRRSWLDTAAVTLYFLAAIAAVATWFSGRSAANSLGVLPPEVQEALAAHSDMALRTVWTFAVLAVLRGLFEIIRTRTNAASARVLRGLLLLVAFFGFWLLLETADRGGGLVYTYGVAVKAVAAPTNASVSENDQTSSSPEPSTVGASLQPNAEGAVVWKPTASDPHPLPEALQIVKVTPDASLQAERIDGQSEGLKLTISGRVYLLLPEEMGDVVVSLDVDPSQFEGSLGLVHHYRAPTSYESVTLAKKGSAVLESVTDGEAKVLDRKQVSWPEDRSEIAASAAGKHLMGYVDGLTILHGHRSATKVVGKTGLVCEGTGTIELFELRATPASGEADE